MTAIIAICCYLIGSIPLAWLVTWLATRHDLRRLGSGNVGVMNTAIQAGRLAGLLVFAGELGKGMLAVAFGRAWGHGQVDIAIGVLAAVIGSRYMIWLKGAGGRANSCGVGALLIISWPSLLAGLAIWACLRRFLSSSFAATRAALAAWPILVGAITHSVWFSLTCAVIAGLYLLAQRQDTDDHLIVCRRYGSLGGFLLGREPRPTMASLASE
jgi:glycerol-3-phosphate acyltransferase PlsY